MVPKSGFNKKDCFYRRCIVNINMVKQGLFFNPLIVLDQVLKGRNYSCWKPARPSPRAPALDDDDDDDETGLGLSVSVSTWKINFSSLMMMMMMMMMMRPGSGSRARARAQFPVSSFQFPVS